MTKIEMQAITESTMTAVEKMRTIYSKYSDAGLEMLLESIIYKRMKSQEKAIILAVGIAEMNRRNASIAAYLMAQIKLYKYADRLLCDMEKIPVV